jgi:hypothetical protein
MLQKNILLLFISPFSDSLALLSDVINKLMAGMNKERNILF